MFLQRAETLGYVPRHRLSTRFANMEQATQAELWRLDQR